MYPSAFFFNDPATTEIYTLSLHDALPISTTRLRARSRGWTAMFAARKAKRDASHSRKTVCATNIADRKSTRLNSSHQIISYAVFCLKKKKMIKLLQRYNHLNELMKTTITS